MDIVEECWPLVSLVVGIVSSALFCIFALPEMPIVMLCIIGMYMTVGIYVLTMALAMLFGISWRRR